MAMITAIQTLADVKAFTRQLTAQGLNIHPDTDFSDYMRVSDNQPAYSSEEATRLNRLMQDCYAIADKEGFDIYEEMLAVFRDEMGFNQVCPFQS